MSPCMRFASQPCVSSQANGRASLNSLTRLLPTPNEYRSGSGSPGPRYWQQKADYVISAELNDVITQSITGSETITYHNNSPDVLRYLWLQLDQNIFAWKQHTIDSHQQLLEDGALRDTLSVKQAAS
jgi:hypothetical protein